MVKAVSLRRDRGASTSHRYASRAVYGAPDHCRRWVTDGRGEDVELDGICDARPTKRVDHLHFYVVVNNSGPGGRKILPTWRGRG